MIKKIRERLEIGATICVDGVWYEAVPQRKRYTRKGCALDANDTFLELVEDGLTKRELARNIERRPDSWKRFEGFMPNLPD